MICKRMLQAALYGLTGLGASFGLAVSSAKADTVNGITTQSQANRLSLFHDYSLTAVGNSSTSIPGSSGTGALTSMLGNWASTDVLGGNRAYAITFTPLVGYDSNPDARRVAQGSPFAGGDLTASYKYNLGADDPTIGSPTQFRVAYDATGAFYDGSVESADTFQQTLSGSYRRSLFHDTLYIGLALDDQFTTEHGSAFLNTFDAIPSVEWFFYPQASAEANYDYTSLSFSPHFVTRRSPDADRSTVNLKLHLYPTPQVRGPIPESPDVLGDILRQSLSRFTIGYGAVFNQARGLDYHYESNRLSIGFEGLHYPKFDYVTLDATYSHEWQNYLNPSTEGPLVLAGKPAQVRRKDHVDVFTLRANARLFDLPHDRGTIATYLQWDLIADRSNIVVRHFNEFVVSGGVTYRF